MNSKNGWKKVRVVVELSVKGNYTDNDFARDLSYALDSTQTYSSVSARFKTSLPRLRGLVSTGKFKVASFNRVQAAEAAKSPIHGRFAGLRQSTALLTDQIRQLESQFERLMLAPPRFDLAKQVAKLGADSLLPPPKKKRKHANNR